MMSSPDSENTSTTADDIDDAPDDGLFSGTYDARKDAEHHERVKGSVLQETQQKEDQNTFASPNGHIGGPKK